MNSQTHRSAFVIRLVQGLVALWGLCTASAALAGDTARANVIGFSADGAYVAFEEYGIQDGSGFPYSNIYVIDVAANDWVSGSPVRVLLTYDDMSEEQLYTIGLGEARRRAMQQVQPVLNARGIVAGNTGLTLVSHPPSDLAADPFKVHFSITAAFVPGLYDRDDSWLRLTQRPAISAQCESFTPPDTMIFTLELEQDGARRALQHDTQLFSSRGCPTGYRIDSVIAYPIQPMDELMCCAARHALLVLVGMSSFGFEGPDWRFLGVTAMMD